MNIFIQKNRKKILIMIFCLCVFFNKIAENVPVTTNDPLCSAMQATGAELSKAYITGKAVLNIEKDQQIVIQKILKEICSQLNVNFADISLEKQKSKYQSYLKLSYADDQKQLIVTARDIDKEEQKAGNIELIIHVIQESPVHTDIINVQKKISEILQNFNQRPLITTCLEGYLDGKLRKGEWEFCIKDAFAAINAKIVSGISDENYISYSGYSDLLGQALSVNKQFVNVNIAMRYHAFDNRTYVIIGSPIITIEY